MDRSRCRSEGWLEVRLETRKRKDKISNRKRPFDIETNVELRAIALSLRHAGWNTNDIAEFIDVSADRVRQIISGKRPSLVRKLSRATTGAVDECECGNLKISESVMCESCRIVERETITAERCDKLLKWAEKYDAIPTVNQAAQILRISRSSAGEVLITAFGRDKRLGANRRSVRVR